jgi:undecaprenyl diphosphate synthase
MDGNGRWAQAKKHSRSWGHVRGSNNILDIVEAAADAKVTELTLFAFSTENWGRSRNEVDTLLGIMRKFLLSKKEYLVRNRVYLRVIGQRDKIPQDLVEDLDNLSMITSDNYQIKLNIAFSYGGKFDIIQGVNRYFRDHDRPITYEGLERYLLISRVDLLIRTGGEFRISNFLLWQIDYAELFFPLSSGQVLVKVTLSRS